MGDGRGGWADSVGSWVFRGMFCRYILKSKAYYYYLVPAGRWTKCRTLYSRKIILKSDVYYCGFILASQIESDAPCTVGPQLRPFFLNLN